MCRCVALKRLSLGSIAVEFSPICGWKGHLSLLVQRKCSAAHNVCCSVLTNCKTFTHTHTHTNWAPWSLTAIEEQRASHPLLLPLTLAYILTGTNHTELFCTSLDEGTHRSGRGTLACYMHLPMRLRTERVHLISAKWNGLSTSSTFVSGWERESFPRPSRQSASMLPQWH